VRRRKYAATLHYLTARMTKTPLLISPHRGEDTLRFLNRRTAREFMQIRITGIPPGEAPEKVRQAWIGLVLPVSFARRHRFKTVGVLSGPTGHWNSFLASRRGEIKSEGGYAVAGQKAVEILSRHAPEAAAWWRQNAPRSIARGKYLVFAGEVCEVILEEGEVADVPTGIRGLAAKLLGRMAALFIILGICTPIFAAGSSRHMSWGLPVAMILLGLFLGFCAARLVKPLK
jgi:hypothetical protein